MLSRKREIKISLDCSEAYAKHSVVLFQLSAIPTGLDPRQTGHFA